MTQTTKLTASDGTAGDLFGWSVAIDGDTVGVGALQGWLCYGSGKAYVFLKPSGGWTDMTQTAELTASGAGGCANVGSSVAISRNTVVAGTWSEPHGLDAAYVFVKPASGWADMTETAELTDGSNQVDMFGASVGVSGDTVAVGAFDATVGSNQNQGAAYVFVRPATGWASTSKPDAELTASDGVCGSYLGYSVAISGNAVVAGALQGSWQAGSGPTGAGAAYVFVEPPGGWGNMTQTAELTAADAVSGSDSSMAVSITGNTVVAGTPSSNAVSVCTQNCTPTSEAAYVFAGPGGTTGQDFALTPLPIPRLSRSLQAKRRAMHSTLAQ
jgi:hypothetical protein